MRNNGEGTGRKENEKEKENSPNKHILVLPTHGLF